MFIFLSKFLRGFIWLTLTGIVAMAAATAQASASLIWDWSYSGAGIVAGGTFTTNDSPDGSGFYLITAITGTRNGQLITGLQPAGTAIPGNEPFAVDNLVRTYAPQLTVAGFGYSLADGNYANPFFDSFLSTPGYMEFLSAQPFTGGIGPGDSELPITFFADIAIPEPESHVLLLVGLGLLGCLQCCKARPPS